MVEITLPVIAIEEPSTTKEQERPKSKRRMIRTGIVSLLALAVMTSLAIHLLRRGVEKGTGTTAVDVVKAVREDLVDDIALTAEFRPYQEVSLHAKVSGYVKKIDVDIGDHVKEGQIIAELEIPELRDELRKASAAVRGSQEEVKRAEANYSEAHLPYERLKAVAKERPNLVAQQEIDNAAAKDASMAGALGNAKRKVEETQAEESRMRAMLSYSSITAPFDGVITKRYADTGSLIQAGITSDTQAMPLIDLAQDNILRLVFPAPESLAPLIHVGAPVEFSIKSLDQTERGTISRFSGELDRATRTMNTEVDVPNPDGRFKQGMYASVKLIRHESKQAIVIPVRAILAGEAPVGLEGSAPSLPAGRFGVSPSVLVVNNDSTVESRNVSVGLETREMVEIKSGLNPGELVIIGRRGGVHPGQKVSAKFAETTRSGE